jgi:hypothetical protein
MGARRFRRPVPVEFAVVAFAFLVVDHRVLAARARQSSIDPAYRRSLLPRAGPR